ncbi:MAG: hypothetical protein FJY07_02590 [Bacteroidetes bacterium]|nr:hypothetical protein [Bacteroidota bacterium]
MKTQSKRIIILLVFLVFIIATVFADAPPEPGGGPGGGNGPVGGGSPVGSGAIVFIISGLIYGIRKSFMQLRRLSRS